MNKFTKLISFLLFITLLSFATACGKNDYEFKDVQEKNSIIFQFESKISENNIAYDKIDVNSNDQNAKGLYYYYIEENNPLVVYLFDESSEEYKSILQNKQIKQGHNPNPIDVEVNKGIVIEKNESMKYYDKIIKILNEL